MHGAGGTEVEPPVPPPEPKGDMMNIMTLLIVTAVLCVIASLVLGLAAMAHHGEIGHRTSSQWMTMRVTFQAVALVLVLLSLLS
jgi:hypothetical protein